MVWQGVEPGIYDNWNDCKAQIQGFPDAKYKSFPTREEANAAYGGTASDFIGKSKKKPKDLLTFDRSEIIWDSLSVDAACSGSPGVMEYRGVWTEDGTEVFRKGPFEYGTNNVGEFLALVHGISWLRQIGKEDTPIYSDSRTALAWLRNKKTKTTLERRAINEGLFRMFDRAERWIQENTWSNPIHKWDTKRWGEIPADFGRK